MPRTLVRSGLMGRASRPAGPTGEARWAQSARGNITNSASRAVPHFPAWDAHLECPPRVANPRGEQHAAVESVPPTPDPGGDVAGARGGGSPDPSTRCPPEPPRPGGHRHVGIVDPNRGRPGHLRRLALLAGATAFPEDPQRRASLPHTPCMQGRRCPLESEESGGHRHGHGRAAFLPSHGGVTGVASEASSAFSSHVGDVPQTLVHTGSGVRNAPRGPDSGDFDPRGAPNASISRHVRPVMRPALDPCGVGRVLRAPWGAEDASGTRETPSSAAPDEESMRPTAGYRLTPNPARAWRHVT